MTDSSAPHEGQDNALVIARATPPTLVLNRIARIETYEVMENELDTLDQIVAEETQALAFASICLGSLVSALLNVFVAGAMSVNAKIVYGIVLAFGVMGTLWFGGTWLRVRKKRPALLNRVKTRTERTLQSQHSINPA